MNNNFTSLDEKSRDIIVNDIHTNLFVEAGAGSGKTTMLVNRMVAMVEEGLPVEKIAAITFTKNAALEFYDRFEAKLIERSHTSSSTSPKRAGDLNEPNDETRKRCLKALQDIDLCFMGTIDSFCNMILLEHPNEAEIPSDARLLSTEEADKLYRQFYVDVLNGKYDDLNLELKVYAKRFSLLFYKPEEAFSTLIQEIMDRRNVEFKVDDTLCIDFISCFRNARQDFKKVLNVFNKDKSKLTLALSKNDDRDQLEVYDNANATIQRGWQYNFTGVIRALNDLKGLSYNETPDELGFTNESIVRKKDNTTILNINDEDNPDALIFKLKNYRYQNSLKLCLMCIKPLEDLMRKEGKLTFFDCLYYLRNMLVKDAKSGGKLINYIYNRHSYFLIDEFQDTNPLQLEVFFYLSAKDTNKDAWWKCVPKEGSLFIVGDPKQSIYRFRSADVASYLNIKKLFENEEVGKVLYLVNNFRSKNLVKDYFNKVFEEVMDEESAEQSKYLDIENISVEEKEEFNGIYTYDAYSDSLLADYPEMEDNKQLAKIVKSLVDNPKTKIFDKKLNDLRTLRYSDIMIIFAGKGNIAPCIKEFENQNIPIRVEGKVLFEECDALKTIFEVYKALSDTSDTVALISALYSPLFGLNENDLSKYIKTNKELKIELNKEYGDNEVDKALSKLSKILKDINKLTPSALFEKIIEDLEIFKYVKSDRLEIVYYVLELIRNEERTLNIVNFEDAVAYMDNLLSGESGVERCLSLSQNFNAVHIANLHKVKGLEAPVVILAKAGTSSTSPDIRIEYERSDDGTSAKGYIINVSDNGDNHFKLIETNAYNEQAEKEKLSLKKENERLVYVAATRAKNVLIICEPKRAGKAGPVGMGNKWKALKDKAINGNFFECFEDNPSYKEKINEEVNAKDLYEKFKETPIISTETYSLRKPSDIKFVPRTSEEIEETNNLNDYAALLGTMVHALLERIIMSKDKINEDTVINYVLNEYLDLDHKDLEDEIRKKLVKVYDVMHKGGFKQKGNAPEDILKVLLNADEVYSEIPFTYKKDNVIINGIIDLVYLKDNKLHIIDWKTNKEDDNLDEHYKDQLDAYKAAIKEITGLEASDTLIYHININD